MTGSPVTAFGAAFVKDLRRRAADWRSLAIWIAIPIAMGFLLKVTFGGPSGGTPRAELLVVLEDSDGLLPWLIENGPDPGAGGPPVVVERVASVEEAVARIEANEVSAYLELPPTFLGDLLDGEPHELVLVTNPARSFSPRLIEDTLNLLIEAAFRLQSWLGPGLDDFREELRLAAAEGRGPSPLAIAGFAGLIERRLEDAEELLFPPALAVELEEAEGVEPELSFTELFFPSLLMLSLLFLAGGLSEDLWAEKAAGTLRRALSLPHGGLGLLLGKLASSAVLLLAVALTGVLLARTAFGIALERPVLGALFASLTATCATSLLLAAQTLTRTQRAGSLVANLVVLPLAMIGGCFFPFEAMPAALAEIGRATPAGWALIHLRRLLAEPVAPVTLLAPSLLLLAVGTLALLFTLRRLRGAFGNGGTA